MANVYGGNNTGKAGLRVKEADGSPDVAGVSEIVVSNGTLTDDGNGVVTLTTGGGGGTPGGSDTQVQYNDAGSFGGNAGLTFDDASSKLTVGGEIQINGNLNHDGSNIGFFTTAPTTQQPTTAYTPSAIPSDPVSGGPLDIATAGAIDAQLNDIQTSLQSIIDLLQAYGLSS
jgi:hypothetical protein